MSRVRIYKWRIYCQSESTYQYVWSDQGITQCPTNTSHTVSNDVIIVDSVEGVKITNSDSPYTFNNKSILANTTNGNIQINMLKASRLGNRIVIIKKTAVGNTLSVYPNSGDSINGSTNAYNMSALNETLILKSDGITNWTKNTDFFSDPDLSNTGTFSTNKGDILVDDGIQLVRLAVGNDNEILTADSTKPLGLGYKSLNNFTSNILFSSCFVYSNTQPYMAVTTTTDSTLAVICIANNPPVPTKLTIVAAMNSSGATGVIKLKEASTLTTLATITIPSTITTNTVFTSNIATTSQTMFLLTVSTTASGKSTNVYSVVFS